MNLKRDVSVAIPARNEAGTVGGVVRTFLAHDRVAEVIVADNASSDGTAAAARDAGARVVEQAKVGYGRTVKTAIKAAANQLIFKCDSDIRNPDIGWLCRLLDQHEPGVSLVKGAWSGIDDPLPVTNYAVKPALKVYFPRLLRFKNPLSGQFLLDRSDFAIDDLAHDYFLDLDMLIRADLSGLQVREVDIGPLQHADRASDHNSAMCTQLISGLAERSRRVATRTLVITAHPDDALIFAGGVMVKYLSLGAQVSVISVFGDDTTAAELRKAGDFFPSLQVECLQRTEFSNFGAGLVEHVSEMIVEFEPTLIVTHHYADPHPDHVRVCRLVQAALMRNGRVALPERILLMSPYFGGATGDGAFRPDVYVDITAEQEMKRTLISTQASQEPDHWAEMCDRMEALSGMAAGAGAAEAFETMRFYMTPKAGDWL